jgi:hypothetical protein
VVLRNVSIPSRNAVCSLKTSTGSDNPNRCGLGTAGGYRLDRCPLGPGKRLAGGYRRQCGVDGPGFFDPESARRCPRRIPAVRRFFPPRMRVRGLGRQQQGTRCPAAVSCHLAYRR